MKAILAGISLVISAAYGAIKIWKISKGDLLPAEKVGAIHVELAKIVGKLEVLAQNTEPTWDDTLAVSLAGILDVVAENLIDQLEGKE